MAPQISIGRLGQDAEFRASDDLKMREGQFKSRGTIGIEALERASASACRG